MSATLLAALSNQVLTIFSRIAELEAQPNLAFRSFVQEKQEFGTQPGQTMQFVRLGALARGKRLTEMDPMPVQLMRSSTVQITVYEWGNSVLASAQLAHFSFRDVMQDAALLLGQDYALVLDEYLRDTYLTTANVLYGAGGANDAAITSLTGMFNTDRIKDAVEILKTLNVAPVRRPDMPSDKAYIAFAHPHQLRDLRDDGAWQDAHKYVNPQFMYAGEAGRYENVIFIETTQMPILAGVGSGGIDVYEAVVFGDRCVGFGESMPIRMTTNGLIDHDRWLSLGWRSIFGAGMMNDFAVALHTA